MQLDIYFAKQTSANHLPDEAQNEMFSNLDYISTSNVNNRTTNTLRRLDDNVVVLGHMECVEGLDLLASTIQDSLVDGVRDAVVDQFGENQSILAFIKHLKGVGWKR